MQQFITDKYQMFINVVPSAAILLFLIFRPEIAQLLKDIWDMGVGVIL